MSQGTQAPGTGSLWGRNLLVWLALLVLLGLSCAAAYMPFGRAGVVIGLAIAAVKAGIVAVLFMNLRRSGALVRLAAAAGFFWIVVLFALTLSDILMRLGGH